jgi:predicted dehydrogenase
MPDKPENTINRRSFLNRTASLLAGTALGATAASYGRIVGANDRLSLGHIGVGSRGGELDWIVSRLKEKHNVEMTAVCDLWKVNREKAVLANRTYYGRPPRQFQYLEDLLLLKDVDAVLISTPDHSHSPILKLAAEAGKDAYVEKPMGNVLEEIKAARDAVLEKRRVVQVGTQHRSEPYPQAACELIQTGALGEVSKVEIVWNYHGPRWRGRREVKELRAEDTDWRKWLMTKPPRPFDPQLYFEFRLYKEFSGGIADQWMSHALDLVHWFMGDKYPRSVVAHGGIYAWPDGRENPDTFQALLEYPKGFMVSYSTSFGNDAPSFTRYMGKKATLMNIGGEGSPRYKLVEEKGNHEDNPDIDRLRAEKDLLLPGDKTLPPAGMGDLELQHMENWLECLRSRQQPHSTVSDGYAHSLACIMAAQSFWAGKKVYYDPATETIVDHAPAS